MTLASSHRIDNNARVHRWQMHATDPVVMSAVAGLLLPVATLACALPARRGTSAAAAIGPAWRAARVDPIAARRGE